MIRKFKYASGPSKYYVIKMGGRGKEVRIWLFFITFSTESNHKGEVVWKPQITKYMDDLLVLLSPFLFKTAVSLPQLLRTHIVEWKWYLLTEMLDPWSFLRFLDIYFHDEFFDEFYVNFFDKFFWRIFLANFLTNFDKGPYHSCRIYLTIFLILIRFFFNYTLITIASFRIGVPSILFVSNFHIM